MNKYKKIANYFNYLSKTYNLSICVKDFSGIIPLNKDLNEVLQPYLAHRHSYCILLKREKNCYLKCLSMMQKMLEKAVVQKETFFGACYGGLGEYVIPIINGENVIGAITLGTFRLDENELASKFQKITAMTNNIDIATLNKKYEETVFSKELDYSGIIISLEIIAETIAMSYSEFDVTDNRILVKKDIKNTEDKIVENAVSYIRENLTKKIKTKDLAESCGYCESYVSRLFKRKMGMNINTYINKMRVEVSKNYLLTTGKTIAEISELVGFDEPSYYCKVFSAMLAIPPAEFRRRFK